MDKAISVMCEDVAWKFKCSRKWGDLTLTYDENMRFCEGCSKSVFYCHSFEELMEKSEQGLCVAYQDSEPVYSRMREVEGEDFLMLGRVVGKKTEGKTALADILNFIRNQ